MIAISFIFFLSGLSALVYQLLWMRHLGFIFGNTVYASATVLTAFMGGLAIGSHLFGKWADRLKNPVRWFAYLEWITAGSALAMPVLFTGIRHLYAFAYRNISDQLLFLTPLRFVLALLILAVPTICMGGTLPVLIRGLAREEEHFGRRLGWLYGINTLGAVAGVLVSGLYLIEAVGLQATNVIAVMTDVCAGAGAWFVSRSRLLRDPEPAAPREPIRWKSLTFASKYAIGIATLCGFMSLALEVIWFRALVLVFGSTTYSFTVMLSVFLFGIGAGSLLIAPVLDRRRDLFTLLAVSIAAVGVAGLWSMYRFDRGPEFLLHYLLARGFSWAAMMEARFLIAVSHLLLPALLFGVAFATAVRIVRHDTTSSAGSVGLVYALNTLGAVAGSFMGGFMLLPLFGMAGSLFLISAVAITAGLVSLMLWSASVRTRVLAVAVAVPLLAFVGLNPPVWNKSILASGAFFAPFNSIRDGRVVFREVIVGDRLLYYREGLSSTVSVHISDDETMYFCVDGKTEADEAPRGMVVQRMIGHLPMLFHPNARNAVNIGLGAGVSFGALGCYPLDRLEVVEIEKATLDGARIWSSLNHGILDHPNARVIINDGRNYLFCTTNMYDVISADPFEPVVGGASHLFTVEYWEHARERLNPGGIICQWVPMYEMSTDDYLMIVRSFVHVFPRSALFFTGFDTLLLGFKSEMRLDAEVLRRNYEIPAVRKSLSEVGFTSPEMILGMFVSDLSQHPEFVGSGPLNTDQRPRIEFSVPRSAMRYTTDENHAALLAYFTQLPADWLEGLEEDVAEKLEGEHEAVRLMLEAAVLRAQGDTDGAFDLLSLAHTIAPDNPVVRNEMVAMLTTSAQTARRSGQYDEAAWLFRAALDLDPRDFWSLHNMVELGMNAGQVAFAGQTLTRALEYYPESPLIMSLRGKYLFSTGQPIEGLNLMRQAVEKQPGSMMLSSELRKLAEVAGDAQLAAWAADNIRRIEAFVGKQKGGR
jgi:spermidine synthase